MRIRWSVLIFALTLVSFTVQAQENSSAVLQIQQSVTTAAPNFPQFVFPYRVLDGVRSSAEARALSGTISLKNFSPNFSEVLWVLVYWRGQCPGPNGSLDNATILWTDILKNPAKSTTTFPVDLHFPQPLPMTGCVGLVFAGGSLVEGTVTMAADLNLTYGPKTTKFNNVMDLSGEYCFGMNWGCQNATLDDTLGFAVPEMVTGGPQHLVELMGNISDSTFDGTQNFGPLPTGESWGAVNDFYLLHGSCGKFEDNLNSQGFPNPVALTTLYSWLPPDAVHLDSVPLEYQVPNGQSSKATLQKQVERIFPNPLAVNTGDCIVVIYGRSGNGATDNETQVHAVLTP